MLAFPEASFLKHIIKTHTQNQEAATGVATPEPSPRLSDPALPLPSPSPVPESSSEPIYLGKMASPDVSSMSDVELAGVDIQMALEAERIEKERSMKFKFWRVMRRRFDEYLRDWRHTEIGLFLKDPWCLRVLMGEKDMDVRSRNFPVEKVGSLWVFSTM